MKYIFAFRIPHLLLRSPQSPERSHLPIISSKRSSFSAAIAGRDSGTLKEAKMCRMYSLRLIYSDDSAKVNNNISAHEV